MFTFDDYENLDDYTFTYPALELLRAKYVKWLKKHPHYGLFMSRLMKKDYEMKTEDLSKLYSLLPADVQKEIKSPEGFPADTPLELPAVSGKNYTGWVAGGAAAAFLVAFVIGLIIRKKTQR